MAQLFSICHSCLGERVELSAVARFSLIRFQPKGAFFNFEPLFYTFVKLSFYS